MRLMVGGRIRAKAFVEPRDLVAPRVGSPRRSGKTHDCCLPLVNGNQTVPATWTVGIDARGQSRGQRILKTGIEAVPLATDSVGPHASLAGSLAGPASLRIAADSGQESSHEDRHVSARRVVRPCVEKGCHPHRACGVDVRKIVPKYLQRPLRHRVLQQRFE